MARPLRIEYQGAFYHVIVRGNRRQDIFVDDEDRTVYLERLKRYKERYGFIIYAYVLMTNHVHLLIETLDAPISKVMHGINFTFTQHFNRRHEKVGHLFQGRYKALVCDRDSYLLALVRYIHLNPVRSGLVETPGDYRWSSYNAYFTKHDDLIEPDRVLRVYSENRTEAKRLYKEFVLEDLGKGRDERFYKVMDQQILGDEGFLEEVSAKAEQMIEPLGKITFEAILQAVEEVSGVSGDDMLSRKRGKALVFARGLLVAVWRTAGHTTSELAALMQRERSVLSKLNRLVETPEGRRVTAKIVAKLNAQKHA